MTGRLSPTMLRVLAGTARETGDGSVAGNDVEFGRTVRALRDRGLLEENPDRPRYYRANEAGRAALEASR